MADTISLKVSFAPTTSPVNRTYTFAGFDPALGNLDAVILAADESFTTTGSITNQSQYAGPWDIEEYGKLRVQFTNAAGSSEYATPPVVPSRSVTVLSINPGAAYIANISDADANTIDLNDNSVAQFFETGPISANLYAEAVPSVVVPNGVTYSSSLATSINGSFSVIYRYTPAFTPEPASGK